MDKDRIKGSAEQAKGKVKEVAGQGIGRFEAEIRGQGLPEKGKVENAVGGIKDALRGR